MTGNLAVISRFHLFQINERYDFFFIFRNSFLYKITVSFTMVIKRSPGGQACRWRAINFEIHLWSSGKNADCIFGDRSASSMSKWRPAWTLTPEMIHFRTKSVTLSMLIDLLIIVHVDWRRWRAHQLTYDLKRCLLFRKCLRFFESESSFGAYVCHMHRRPGGSMATSHLVATVPASKSYSLRSQIGYRIWIGFLNYCVRQLR